MVKERKAISKENPFGFKPVAREAKWEAIEKDRSHPAPAIDDDLEITGSSGSAAVGPRVRSQHKRAIESRKRRKKEADERRRKKWITFKESFNSASAGE